MTEQPPKLFDIQVDKSGNPVLLFVPQGSTGQIQLVVSWEQLHLCEVRAGLLREAAGEVPAM